MKKVEDSFIDLYKFVCPVCNNSFQCGKPFTLYYCPYCGLDINAYKKEMRRWEQDSSVKNRDILDEMKSKYSLTDEEKDAIDYATMLIQSEIDGEVD